MELILPEGEGWSGAVIRGLRRSGGAQQDVWSVVVKRAYRRTGVALVPDGDGEALRSADEMAGQQVAHEGDLAVFKPRADLVVRGHRDAAASETQGGQIRVGGVVRLTRSALSVDPEDGDADRHLFGFEPRTNSAREADAGDWPDADPTPAQPIPLPGSYSNEFMRYQRRSGGFSGIPLAALPVGATVEVFQTSDASDTAWSVAYALPTLAARHFTWCGRGPDRTSRWCGETLSSPTPDTLVLNPDSGTATVLWRAVWPGSDHPTDRYRRLIVTEGGT